MKVNIAHVLNRCIQDGIELGWNRGHKHTDTPDPEYVKTLIDTAIWGELDTYFIFEGKNIEEDNQ